LQRRISFNWGNKAEVPAARATAPLSESAASAHREFIVTAVNQQRSEGQVRERLGLLMADKLPFGADVCLSMMSAGVRLQDARKIMYWADVTLDENHSLPTILLYAACNAFSSDAQHTKAAQFLLMALHSDSPQPINAHTLRGVEPQVIKSTDFATLLENGSLELLCSAATSLVKSGNVSHALLLQTECIELLHGASCTRAGPRKHDTVKLSKLLEKMSVLWLPAGNVEACLQAYRCLAVLDHVMPLALVSQLLQAAADAEEWQLCQDVLDCRHHTDAGEASLLAMDSVMKPVVLQALSASGADTALAFLFSASTWLGHSMPETASALSYAFIEQQRWDEALQAVQYLLRRPRSKAPVPAAMRCVGTLAGHLLLQGQGHAAGRLLFTAVHAWDGRWRTPTDLSDAWVRAAVQQERPPPVDHNTKLSERGWKPMSLPSLRPNAPIIGTPIDSTSCCSPALRVHISSASSLMTHNLATGRPPSVFSTLALVEAAAAVGEHCIVLEATIDALVAATYDSLVPLSRRPPTQDRITGGGTTTAARGSLPLWTH
jgi:hypothetical protein